MNMANNKRDAFITVIPYHPQGNGNYKREITIDKLYFWHNNTFDHPVNDESVTSFLLHVQLFGAIVYPDCPELGCMAVNGDQSFVNGETCVSEIRYKGDVIYCRS